MKFIQRLVRLLTIAALGIAAREVHADANKIVWNSPTAFTEPGLTHHSFASRVMNLEVGYSVWLPPGYETGHERFPVIYFLHGSGGNESADAPAFSHLLAERVLSGKIAPAICIFPNGGLSGYRDGAMPDSKVESMIIRELVPLIDTTYRTKNDRAARVIGGFSMGGGGALRLALVYPQLFSAAAAWAGPITGGAEEGGVKPMFDVVVSTKPEDRVRLLLIVGYDDLTYPWHAPTLAALQSNKYPFILHTIGDMGHDLGRYYSLTGDEFVEFLTRGFPLHGP